MNILAVFFIFVSSVLIGIMSILRKEYQIANGTSMKTTLFFTTVVSVVGFLVGVCANKGFEWDITSLCFAFVYAVISTASASICIYASAYGNISTLLTYAMLGNLVLPSLFGIISQPSENILTIYKTFGFLMAAICFAMNFSGVKHKKIESLRFKILCGIVFFTQGSALIVYNLKTRFCTTVSSVGFIAQYMLMSAVITAVLLMILQFKTKASAENIKLVFNKKSILIMMCYALFFLCSDFLGLKSAGMIPLTIQASVTFSIPIITTAALDFLVYKVKLTKINVLQIMCAFLCCISFILENQL